MSCCLPFLSGILPPSASDKFVVDVRGGGTDDTASSSGGAAQGSMTGFFRLLGAGKKPEDVVEEEPYEDFYRIWFNKGLLCFKPKSLGGSGSGAALVRRLDEALPAADLSTKETETTTKDQNGSHAKSGHDWSKQSAVESQSQTEGRSLHNFWEARSNTSPSKPETAPKAVPIEL